jgi:hypothetical protein
MQVSVQISKLNRAPSHDKGSTLRGFGRCPGLAWPGPLRGNPPWLRAPGHPA